MSETSPIPAGTPVPAGTPAPSGTPARAFISYAQEGDELANDVLALAQQLRRQDGIDAWIDRYEQQVPQGWRPWMTGQIARASDRHRALGGGAAGRRFDRAMRDWIAVASACVKVGSCRGRGAAGSPRPRHEHDKE